MKIVYYEKNSLTNSLWAMYLMAISADYSQKRTVSNGSPLKVKEDAYFLNSWLVALI